MTISEQDTTLEHTQRCPFPHDQLSQRRTAPMAIVEQDAAVCDAHGVWHIHSFADARAVLRSEHATQAGFSAEAVLERRTMKPPVLFMDGEAHHAQRKQIARFFTPKKVSTSYRELMEGYADRALVYLKSKERVDLSYVTLKLAVRIAAEVVGLTDSILPGMARRLEMITESKGMPRERSLRTVKHLVRQSSVSTAFYRLDVLPAIRARRRQRRDDVISHLLDSNYNDLEILVECITYGGAGMVTTREFISVVAWHMLEQPDLREYYMNANEEARHQLLEEILRLEPVVATIIRRAQQDIPLPSGTTIPAGALVRVSSYHANADMEVTGANPHMICPARELQQPRVPASMMGFGDGVHRCPGAYIAIHETDIFMQKFLRLPNLRVLQKPTVTWNPLLTSYEVRNFIISAS